MPIPFPSDEWIKALKDELNASETYRDAARNWEGDFCFVISRDDAGNGAVLYLDLWHGACREAAQLNGAAERNSTFVIEAPLATWRKVIEVRLDPIQALVTRQLKLKGDLLKIMRVPRAAMELVRCCTRVETQWPVAAG